MKKVQSKSDYDDNDDEDGDLESAAVAQRLIQSCSPGFFQAVVLGNVFFLFSCCYVRMCTGSEWCSSSVMTSCNCTALSFGALFFNIDDFDDDAL